MDENKVMYMLGKIDSGVETLTATVTEHIKKDESFQSKMSDRVTSLETTRTQSETKQITYTRMVAVVTAVVTPLIALYHFFIK